MLLIDSEKTIIFHTPKCGGKALREAFSSIVADGVFWDWRWLHAAGEWVDQAHVPLHMLRQTKIWDEIRDYTLISVVRDPWPRFVSSLKEHMKQHRKRDALQVLDELDEVRIAHDPRYIHFIPQNRFTHLGNKRCVDFIVRAESLAEDLRAVGIICGMKKEFFRAVDNLPSMPISPIKNEAVDVEQKMQSLLMRFYRRDYALFGYTPPAFVEEILPGFNALLVDPICNTEWNSYETVAPAYERFVRQSNKDFLISKLREEINELKKYNLS